MKSSFVELNGQRYPVEGAVVESTVSPFAPQISSGRVEFKNFGPASVWEKKDLRGGMGLFREESETNRYYWAENMNVTKDGRWTIGGAKTAIGSFGATPTVIVLFEGTRYGFSNGASKYDASGTWTATGDSSPLSSPTDGLTFKDENDMTSIKLLKSAQYNLIKR